jgi:hypothetical protein
MAAPTEPLLCTASPSEVATRAATKLGATHPRLWSHLASPASELLPGLSAALEPTGVP